LWKLLFNREGIVVRAAEVTGLLGTLRLVWERPFPESLPWILLLLDYLFIRFCDLYPWYPRFETPAGFRDRQVGIRVHFRKALVPTSFILSVAAATDLIGPGWFSSIGAIFANLCMLVVVSVNLILIRFHLRDHSPLPVNYFSHNKYLEAGDAPSGN